MINGLGRFNPSTVVARVGMLLFPFSVANVKKHPQMVPLKFQDWFVVAFGDSVPEGRNEGSQAVHCRIEKRRFARLRI